MKSSKLMSIAALSSTILMSGMVLPNTAAAAEKRLAPSAFCQPEYAVTKIFENTIVNKVQRVGAQLRAKWGSSNVICGYPSDSALYHSHVDLVRIRGYRGNHGDFVDAAVRACVGNFVGTQHCGYQTDFGDGGNFSVDVGDLSKWNNYYWYPYLSVKMQPGDRLYGIVATD